MYRTIEDGRALLRAAQEVHAERHGAQTFTPGTHLPLVAAGERTGLSPNRLRYHDAVQELEYEGAIEWDPSARYARGTSTTSSLSVAWTVLGSTRGGGPLRKQPGRDREKEDAR